MTHQNHPQLNDHRANRSLSRRTILAWSGATMLTGLAGCAGSDGPGNRTASAPASSPAVVSAVREIQFEGPNLVVLFDADHEVSRLNLIAPDGSTYRQTGVEAGATRAELQILSKTGDSYTAGQHELVAVSGESSESMPIELRPAIDVVDVQPELDDDDRNSTGRLLVTVENAGSGPTWIYNIGFRNAAYQNAPQVIDGDGVADTTFERPEDPMNEFLAPGTARVFLKRRGVLVISDDDDVTCAGGTADVTVVVQTSHGDVEQPIRARLSGGYHVDDEAAIQHPCQDVDIELLDGGGGSE